MSDKPIDVAVRRILDGPEGPRIGAFFDYDGTLIDGFSAAAYFVDRIKRREMGARELVETVKIARKGDLSDAEFADVIGKGIVEWAGRSEAQMRAMWHRLWQEKIGATLFPEAWKLVHAHQRMGHTVAVASSATRYQIEPLAEEYGIEYLITTEVKLRNGRLTGGIVGTPAWGQGKADAVRAFARRHKIRLKQSYGYANGNEDIAFLSAVGLPTAVEPKERLEATAAEHDWPVLHFAPRRRGPAAAAARTVGAYAAMGASFLAGLGYERLTGDTRRAADLITSVAGDSALAALGVDVDLRGEAHLWAHRPCVFIINHQSKFDMFLMMSLIRRHFVGVAKIEAASVPAFGKYMRMTDFAFLDRAHSARAIDALKPAVDRLKRGLSVVISPEGTRSWTPKLGKFKKGAFHVAQQAGVPVVPVVIHNAGEIMGRNDQIMRSGTVRVTVLPPVSVRHWKPEEFAERIEDVRQQFIDALEEGLEESSP